MTSAVTYEKSYQVRYDECSMFGYLTPAAAVRYLQDIAVLHYTTSNLAEGGNWIARRTVIDFHRPVPAYANLQLRTFVGGTSKVTSQRNYELRLESGEPALTAHTIWVYLGPNGRPSRMPASFSTYFTPDGNPPMTDDPAWPPLPEHVPAVSRQKVRFTDLDILAHMNNAAYVDLLDNAGWEAQGQTPDNGRLLPLQYDIEYRESARLGQELEVQTWIETLAGGEVERQQQVNFEGRLITRAQSRWKWE